MISTSASKVSSDLHIVCWVDDDGSTVTRVRLKVCRGTRDNHRVLYDRGCLMHGINTEMRWWAIHQLCQQAVKRWITN